MIIGEYTVSICIYIYTLCIHIYIHYVYIYIILYIHIHIQHLALLCPLVRSPEPLRSRHVLHGPMSLRGGLHGWGLWCGAWAGRGGKGDKLAGKNVESLGEKWGKMEDFRLFKGRMISVRFMKMFFLRNGVRISSLNVGIAGDFSTQILGLMVIIQLKFSCGGYFVVILRQEMRKCCEVWGCVSDYPLVNVYIANWKITIFNGKINYQWSIFNSKL